MNIDYSTLHYQSLFDDFSTQFEHEEFADCILIAEGKSIKVHKAVLCAQSSFLQKIIGEHTHCDWSITIDGIQFEDLKRVIQFLYKGSAIVNSHQVGSFLVVASLLGMQWIDTVTLLSEQHNSVISNESPEPIPTTAVNVASSQPLPLSNITNVYAIRAHKRKNGDSGKKPSSKSKLMKNERNHSRDFAGGNVRPVTDLAQMDENTFCTTLGLKKNVEARDTVKPQGSKSTRKSVPPLFKIVSSVKTKCSEIVEVSESANLVSESSPVFIEAKNLSFLNELYIRENNIEIECDVLDAASHQLLIEKNTGIQMSEGNIITAQYVDNPD